MHQRFLRPARALVWLLGSILAGLAAAPALACGPGPGGEPGCSGTRNPTHIANGNRYAKEVDLVALPGVLGLEWTRHYNGKMSDIGSVGRGWRHSYEYVLYAVGSSVQVVRADGKRLIFARDESNPAVCASRNPEDGRVLEDKTASGRKRYRWVTAEATEYRFDESGQLESIRAASGEQVILSRNARGELLTVTDPYGRSVRLVYADPKLTRHPLAHRGIVAVDTPLGRVSYTHADGMQSGAGNLERVIWPDGNGRKYLYSAQERGEDASNQNPHLLTGMVALTKDAHGALSERRYATYRYDGQGRAVLTERFALEDGAPTESVRLEFKAGETVLTDGQGRQTLVKHAIVGEEYRVLEVSGSGCQLCPANGWRYEWLPNGQMAERAQIDAQGRVLARSKYAYDGQGRTVREERYAGEAKQPTKVVRYEYDRSVSIGRLPTKIITPSSVDGKEHVLAITYNERGQPLTVMESGWMPAIAGVSDAPQPLVRTGKYSYSVIEGKSVVTQIDGPVAGSVTKLRYDARAQLQAIEYPEGLNQKYELDAIGRAVQETPADGVAVERSFDARGRLTKLARGGVPMLIGYDALERPSQIYIAGGQRLTLQYTAMGKTRALFDAQGNRIEVDYNADGQVQLERLMNPDGSLAMRRERGLGVEPRALAAAGDAQAGLLAMARGAVGPVSIGMAETDKEPNASAVTALTVPGLELDTGGRLQKVRDGRGLETAYTYDDFGRLVAVASPDAGMRSWTFDAADRVTSMRMPDGSLTRYTYDAVGRLTAVITPEGTSTIRWQGTRPVAIEEPHVNYAERYGFDAAGRLIAHTREVDGAKFTTSYAYNEHGQRQAQTLPDGQVLIYRYHGAVHPKAGTLSEVVLAGAVRRTLGERLNTESAPWLTKLGDRPIISGLNKPEDGYTKLSMVLSNGLPWTQSIDTAGRLKQVGTAGLAEWQFSDEPAVTDPDDGADAEANRPRMVRVASRGQDRRAQPVRAHFDAAGNPIMIGSSRALPDDGSNRIMAVVGSDGAQRRFAYNAAGSVTELGEQRLFWDSQQRLREIRRIDLKGVALPVASYRYNLFGERISKTVLQARADGVKTTYFFYEGGQLTAETRAADFGNAAKTPNAAPGAADAGKAQIARQFVYVEHRPVALIAGDARTDTTEVVALHADHRGQVLAATDERRRIVYEASVDPLGRTTESRNQIGLSLRAAGQYADAESGLTYNQRRYLDTETNRFISADPSGQAGGVNLFQHAYNEPLGFVDPHGLQNRDVTGWSFMDRLKYVIEKAIPNVPAEIGNALRDMISPTNLAITAGIFAVWAAAQLTPAGWIADIAIAGLGYFFLGESILQMMKLLIDTYSQTSSAKCTNDLDRAADNMARLTAQVAINLGAAGATKVAGILAKLFKGRPSGVWSMRPFDRGVAIERALGHNVPPSYPVIDRWNRALGVGTSIKSLDLAAATYQNIASLNRTVRGYIDTLASFNGVNRPSLNTFGLIRTRELELVLPSAGSAAQQSAIRSLIAYAATQGVTLRVIIFP